MSTLADLAERLRELHRASEPLVLPNVWDAATARNVVDAGFPAVATTSSGVSAVLGYADGEHTPPDEMFAAIGRISRVVEDVPVTADIESGYGLSPEDVITRLLAAGAVGCNLEDTDHSAPDHRLRDADWQARRLSDVRAAARAQGVNVVLNARVDIFLRGQGEGVVDEAIRRGKLYLQAGADCVFPIGISEETAIVAMVKGIPGPVNVIPGFRGAPPLTRLREIGVRRVSYAGGLFRAMTTAHTERVKRIANWQDA